MRARWHLTKFTKDDNAAAQRLLLRGIELDPGSALAHSSLAFSHIYDLLYGWGERAGDSLAKASEAAQKAVTIDDRDAWALATLGRVDLLRNRHDESIRKLERAVALNPNDPYVDGQLGLTLGLAGEVERAIAHLNEAIRHSPQDPLKAVWISALAITAFYARDYEEAMTWAKQAIRENPLLTVSYRILSASYGQLGRGPEAQAALKELLRLQPGLTMDAARDQIPPTRNPADKERYLEALRKAGMPE
jgi:tetratricopeptide (TPR) repeat protein